MGLDKSKVAYISKKGFEYFYNEEIRNAKWT